MDLTSIVSATPLSLDWVIVAVVAVLLVFDCMRKGSGRAATLVFAALTASFTAQALTSAAYMRPVIAQLTTPSLQAGMFIGIFFFAYVLARRIFPDFGEDSANPLSALLGGLAATAILVVVWLATPQLSALWQFGSHVLAIFGEAYRFWWLLAGLALLSFSRG